MAAAQQEQVPGEHRRHASEAHLAFQALRHHGPLLGLRVAGLGLSQRGLLAMVRDHGHGERPARPLDFPDLRGQEGDLGEAVGQIRFMNDFETSKKATAIINSLMLVFHATNDYGGNRS